VFEGWGLDVTFDLTGLSAAPTETICAFELDTQHPTLVYAIVYQAILDSPGYWTVMGLDWGTGEYIETPVACASPFRAVQEYRKLCGRYVGVERLAQKADELQREQRAWVSEIAEVEE
jgi:hypothetical protein